MKMQNVGVTLCPDYQYGRVEEALFSLLDDASQIRNKTRPGSRVLVKANLCRPDHPDKGTICHPSVVKAAVTYFQKKHCQVIIGDSPGAPHGFTRKTLDTVYEATGMKQVASETGCELNYNTGTYKDYFENAVLLKDITVMKAIKDVDFVVSAAKLKTHAMMRYTGAVKNMFGVIPGRMKMQYHLEMYKNVNFSQILVDICEYAMPALSIMDGIYGMEGNGPAAGDLRNSQLLMASDNPYSLDAVATYLIGMKPAEVPILNVAMKRGLLSTDINDISIIGKQLDEISLEPFKAPDFSVLGDVLDAIPSFNDKLCTSCGMCAESCPPKAIEMRNNRPVIGLDKCIRCFCCQELCPQNAIEPRKLSDVEEGA